MIATVERIVQRSRVDGAKRLVASVNVTDREHVLNRKEQRGLNIETVPQEIRFMLTRDSVADVAHGVVGVGSNGGLVPGYATINGRHFFVHPIVNSCRALTPWSSPPDHRHNSAPLAP